MSRQRKVVLQKGDEGGLAAVLGTEDENTKAPQSANANPTTNNFWCSTHLNGVGSFFLRILRGLFTLTGFEAEAELYRPLFVMLSERSIEPGTYPTPLVTLDMELDC